MNKVSLRTKMAMNSQEIKQRSTSMLRSNAQSNGKLNG